MSSIRPLMIHASHRVNHALGARLGESFPFYYVSEYPKSGGTWLSQMIGDVLQLPVPQHCIFPMGCASVLHNHWGYHRGLRRVVYLSRDGRNVVVSSFFHILRDYGDSRSVARTPARARLDRVFGAGFDAEDTRALLPRFVEHLFDKPLGNRRSWAQHVREWYDPESRPHIAYVSYEELLEDPGAHLNRVAEHVSAREVQDWRIEMAVEKFSIERQTGRSAGQEDRAHFIRKGVAGDWKNHFSHEAARVFDRLTGDELIRLGDEPDRSCVQNMGDAAVFQPVRASE